MRCKSLCVYGAVAQLMAGALMVRAVSVRRTRIIGVLLTRDLAMLRPSLKRQVWTANLPTSTLACTPNVDKQWNEWQAYRMSWQQQYTRAW